MKNKEKKKKRATARELIKEILRKKLGNLREMPRRNPTAQTRTTA